MVLSQLPKQQRAVVTKLPADKAQRIALIEQGVLPQSELMVLHKAMFGGPLAIKVNNTQLALSKALAEQVLVEVK